MSSSCRPTVAEIDLGACVHNLRWLRDKVGAIDIWPVVKADAYGHGAVAVATALRAERVAGFCVATASEGRQLRLAGIEQPVLVMVAPSASAPEDGFRMVLEYGLAVGIQDATAGARLADTARELGLGPASVHLKVDTGMGRLGIAPDQVTHLARALADEPTLSFDGIFSNLASADSVADADPGRDFVRQQIEIFDQVCAVLEQEGILPPHRTLANSAGVMHHPESWQGPTFTGVRPGLAIYGASLTPGRGIVDLRPAMRLVTGIMAIRDLPKGVTVGYGMTATTCKDTRVAVLPLGYHDGLPRALSNCGWVSLAGRRAPIIGRVSMDLTLIDLTDVPDARVDDEVIVFGSATGCVRDMPGAAKSGSKGYSDTLAIALSATDELADEADDEIDDEIDGEADVAAGMVPTEADGPAYVSVEEVSEWAQTIPHEVLSRIGSRVPRCYSQGADTVAGGALR
jgi:alanine racemase